MIVFSGPLARFPKISERFRHAGLSGEFLDSLGKAFVMFSQTHSNRIEEQPMILGETFGQLFIYVFQLG